MRAFERFLEYVTIHTTSDPDNPGGRPSAWRQFALAEKLAAEMMALGLDDVRVDEQCYVYGSIPPSPGCEGAPAIGLIAHMDTAPDAEGEGVVPMLHKNYDGGEVTLADGTVLSPTRYKGLAHYAGQTLITASGGTLLGADDKAGIAEILTACEQVLCGGLPHGRLCIAFTPDEEIGLGADGFDVKAFGADYGYTVDGDLVHIMEYETFNGATARLSFTGVEVHPGEAKDIMVNALRLAAELDAELGEAARPEHTELREGFFHLTRLGGTPGSATAEYIIRDHDRAAFEAKKQAMRSAAQAVQARHAGCAITAEITDSYYNMCEVVEQHMHLVENAKAAIRAAGLVPETKAIRGGTDGSRLSYMGLPCPNLGTGGQYFHGPAECISAEAMDKAVEVLVNLIGIYAKTKREELD